MKRFYLSLALLYCSQFVAAQNVGIGTNTPAYPLTVVANSGTAGGITQKNGIVELGFYTSGSSAYLQTWTAHDLNLATNNGAAKLTIATTNGYVGINTTTPTAQLDVSGSFRLRGNNAGAGKILTAADGSGNANWQDAYRFTLPYSATSNDETPDYAELEITTTSTGTGAGYFKIDNPNNNQETLYAGSTGSGACIRANANGTGNAGSFTIFNNFNTLPALACYTNGTGGALEAESAGFSRDIAIFRNNNGRVARIDGTGKGYFNGGTQTGGADVAEAFAVTGNRSTYEPGDVLIISITADRTVTKSSNAYSTLVAGVYATKPGVLLTERMEGDTQADLVPMGVVGVLPTKVCTEGGPIHRGDLLVTSSTAGHAMKGAKKKTQLGMVIGKALQDFDGNQPGIINVLVNVK